MTRLLLQKAGKSLSIANTRAAGLEEENIRLKQQLDALGPQQPRKRVRIDPNQRFADIEKIVEAMKETETQQAQNKSSKAPAASPAAAKDTTVPAFESMCTKWRL